MKYTQEELQAAFKLVQSNNWKDPIDKIFPGAVPQANKALITEAVIHFTGSIPVFFYDGKNTHVVAAGYYLTIGA